MTSGSTVGGKWLIADCIQLQHTLCVEMCQMYSMMYTKTLMHTNMVWLFIFYRVFSWILRISRAGFMFWHHSSPLIMKLKLYLMKISSNTDVILWVLKLNITITNVVLFQWLPNKVTGVYARHYGTWGFLFWRQIALLHMHNTTHNM